MKNEIKNIDDPVALVKVLHWSDKDKLWLPTLIPQFELAEKIDGKSYILWSERFFIEQDWHGVEEAEQDKILDEFEKMCQRHIRISIHPIREFRNLGIDEGVFCALSEIPEWEKSA